MNQDTNPENNYAIGRRMKVRRLTGEYEILDSRMLGKNRRYDLRAIPGTGAALMTTEAWGADMQPVPEPEPITLVQEHASTFGLPDPAPSGEPAAPDAIRSPATAPEAGFTLDAGAFGGEPDPYSPGAQHAHALDEPGEPDEPQEPLPLRRFPRKITYGDLRSILYNARLKGLESHTSQQIADLDPGTPIAVVTTQEVNGYGVWIILSDSSTDNCNREVALEEFYPNVEGSRADAIEHSVLIALRQMPIRTGVVETSRLVN